MTVRIDRSFAVDASRERVWEFIVDPANRAQAISVVESYAIDDPEGRRATWQVSLPIPLVRKPSPSTPKTSRDDRRSTSSSSANRK